MKSISIRLLLCFGLLTLAPFCTTVGSSVFAKEPAYGFRQQKQGKNRIAINIFNLKSKQVVWTDQLKDVQQVSWTADHRAVVIVEPPFGEPSVGDPYRLIVWEAEKGARIFSHLRFPVSNYSRDQTAFRGDILAASCITQVLLSPDKKHLLIKASWSQGPATVGRGELWCLTLHSRHLQQVSPEIQDDARWQGPHKVHYVRVKNILTPSGDYLKSSLIESRYSIK